MLGFLARRLLATIPVMAIVAVLVFSMLRMTPGDPASIIAGAAATTADVAGIREKLGLDRPIVEQFGIWIGNVLRGDFGESFFFKKTVASLIADRVGPDARARDVHDGPLDRGRGAARRRRGLQAGHVDRPRRHGLLGARASRCRCS
jgi:ABC-type microcin C transport system permease subunit YejB